MLVRDIASIDHRQIQASVHSVTRGTHTFESPHVVIPNKGHFSATFVDTVGFNALDINADHVFKDLQEQVRFSDAIHKILIVHKLGRTRTAVVADTQRTIDLLSRLGAQAVNVYVTITFAYDYNHAVRERMRAEVQELYKEHVLPDNVFFSDYVLLSEVDEDARKHYETRIRRTHAAIVDKMIVERVEPFKPMINTLREMKKTSEKSPTVSCGQRMILVVFIFLSLSLGIMLGDRGLLFLFLFTLVVPGVLTWIAYHH